MGWLKEIVTRLNDRSVTLNHHVSAIADRAIGSCVFLGMGERTNSITQTEVRLRG